MHPRNSSRGMQCKPATKITSVKMLLFFLKIAILHTSEICKCENYFAQNFLKCVKNCIPGIRLISGLQMCSDSDLWLLKFETYNNLKKFFSYIFSNFNLKSQVISHYSSENPLNVIFYSLNLRTFLEKMGENNLRPFWKANLKKIKIRQIVVATTFCHYSVPFNAVQAFLYHHCGSKKSAFCRKKKKKKKNFRLSSFQFRKLFEKPSWFAVTAAFFFVKCFEK